MSVEPRRLRDLPPFDPGTVAVVRASVARLPSEPIELTREFYRQLFTIAPQARALFAEDITDQTERLLSAILAAVRAMDRPELVEDHLRRWGVVHRRMHGVTNDLYVYVGHALIRALHTIFGHLETSVSSAWVAMYEWMAAVMIDGADSAEAIDRDPSAIMAQADRVPMHAGQPGGNVVPFRSRSTGVA
ncbi:MAG TPA: globin domain-containing protein [Kineosporiaceae bacterium]|jgi:hemoglobin-like flavoprotein|nr:globin domain-containing protein [Kineosporiaceae bacterium]